MFSDASTGLIQDQTRANLLPKSLLEQVPIAAIGDETDLLALRFQRSDQPQLRCPGANHGLRPFAERKSQHSKLVLAQLVEHVRLVLALIDGLVQRVPLCAVLDASVVTGGKRVGAQRQCFAQQQPEFDHFVAADAGIGRAALQVGVREGIDDTGAEVILEVEHVIRNAQPAGDAPRILDRIQRAASVVLVEVAGGHLLRPQLQGHAKDLVTLLEHQGSGDR